MAFANARRVPDLADEYRVMAEVDERAARTLRDEGFFRQATYLALQAIEKHVRSVAARHRDFRNAEARGEFFNHSIEASIASLLGIMRAAGAHEVALEQVGKQLDRFAYIDGVAFRNLHNDLRYPHFNRGAYLVLDLSRPDVDQILAKLDWIKSFLKDMEKLVVKPKS